VINVLADYIQLFVGNQSINRHGTMSQVHADQVICEIWLSNSFTRTGTRRHGNGPDDAKINPAFGGSHVNHYNAQLCILTTWVTGSQRAYSVLITLRSNVV